VAPGGRRPGLLAEQIVQTARLDAAFEIVVDMRRSLGWTRALPLDGCALLLLSPLQLEAIEVAVNLAQRRDRFTMTRRCRKSCWS